MKNNPTRRPMGVLVAGGGTGGHLFPGIAVAEAIRERVPDARILFVGTNRGFEKEVLGRAGFEHVGIEVEGFKGRGVLRQIAALFKLAGAFFRAAGIVAKFDPDLILGVGGYASVPCVVAGFFMGKMTAIQEQNVSPGAANRLLSRLAGRVYASFPESAEIFGGKKTLVTGNPVRGSLFAKQEGPVKKEAFSILVLGGSQGAAGINRAMAESLPLLPADRIRVVHQTGEKDFKNVSEAYGRWGGSALVRPFFHDMRERYRDADLIVCRSGATTVAEVTALGRASIFVPFPYAADNHQEKNARVLEEAGAAEVILEKDLKGEVLSRRILHYAKDPAALARKQERSLALGKPGASGAIADDILKRICG